VWGGVSVSERGDQAILHHARADRHHRLAQHAESATVLTLPTPFFGLSSTLAFFGVGSTLRGLGSTLRGSGATLRVATLRGSALRDMRILGVTGRQSWSW
jgi:hypothetical protein